MGERMTAEAHGTLVAAIEGHRDEKRAAEAKRYHKSRLVHWGVRIPDIDRHCRTATTPLDFDEILALASALWAGGIHDLRIAAGGLLAHRKVVPGQACWDRVLAFMAEVDGWALADRMMHGAWNCIAADDRRMDELEQWTVCDGFWWRRAALVFTLPLAKPGADPSRPLDWAAGYVSDPEWFIQKAIGWWLRELGKHDPDRVVDFLNRHWPDLKGVARKEATRRLPPVERARISGLSAV